MTKFLENLLRHKILALFYIANILFCLDSLYFFTIHWVNFFLDKRTNRHMQIKISTPQNAGLNLISLRPKEKGFVFRGRNGPQVSASSAPTQVSAAADVDKWQEGAIKGFPAWWDLVGAAPVIPSSPKPRSIVIFWSFIAGCNFWHIFRPPLWMKRRKLG